jgi:hypothetical protein
VLIDEVDDQQLTALYLLVKDKTLTEWLLWLEDERAAVLTYDALSASKRAKELKVSASSIRYHHACIYLELWRARLTRSFRPLPPNGDSIQSPVSQRELMLQVLASSSAFDPRDFWPFERPPNAKVTTWFPFRDD